MSCETILYFAPGSGLGHLNRALAVCLALRELGIEPEIVTNSPFAEGIARLARFPITGIANAEWASAAPAYAKEKQPQLLVLDTFPAGLRGEWASLPIGVPAVYLARRLKLAAYRDAVPLEWPACTLAIVAEPLAADHELAIATPVVRLPGPIRLRAAQIPTPLPEGLERTLDTGRAWLVVHGGPAAEVDMLCDLARRDMPPDHTLAVISPWPGLDAYDYYPAANVVARAAHVVSGAGYNSMADMLFLRDRHTAVPFERRFDDQQARLAAPAEAADGTIAAASAIAALLR